MKNLQEAIQRHCGRSNNHPIYQPEEFFKFCSDAGAANLYNFILSCMTSSRHSEERVFFLYQLCFGFSQKCNFFQEDNGLFLKFCNVTQSGLGTSCSSKVRTRNRSSLAKVNQKQCNDAITEAGIQKKFPILLMIDDYHNIHTIRRTTILDLNDDDNVVLSHMPFI